jgi:tRNA(Ser,Leu) C12 N-acetylase TAN1
LEPLTVSAQKAAEQPEMHDWNVVVSIREGCYRQARKALRRFGALRHTGFYNVLALKVDSLPEFLESLRQEVDVDPALRQCLARVIPATRAFSFQSPEEFETRAREAAGEFIDALGGKGFYVRMHRRGFRAQLSSQTEERMLDSYLLERLASRGVPGHIAFLDPDAVVDIETVGQWAGVSLWHRAELERYPFIRAD